MQKKYVKANLSKKELQKSFFKTKLTSLLISITLLSTIAIVINVLQ